MTNKEQRVGVFVDVQNLYYSAKYLYNAKVNFSNILKRAVNGRKLIRAFAYVIKTEAMKEKTFFEALEKIGFEIKAKDLQIFHGGAKKGDWDVGISMDVIRMAPKLDTIVLISGDGDYKELLEYAKALGCRAEVIAFGRSASSRIKEATDEFIDLDKQRRKYTISGSRRSSGRSSSSRSGSSSGKSSSKGSGSSSGSSQKPASKSTDSNTQESSGKAESSSKSPGSKRSSQKPASKSTASNAQESPVPKAPPNPASSPEKPMPKPK
ncbi:NYN domain-containing protein [Candidatus Woesearchaeota archaeon]|nr:NYN domain-containing protein [Candidatus Woesearchaeota archaeon]